MTIKSRNLHLLRPLYVSAVLGGAVFAGLMLVQAVDSSAPAGLSYIAVFVFLVGPIRMFNLWFSAGRTLIAVDAEQVLVRGRFGTRRILLTEIVGARIIPGEMWPEWSRWAIHPKVVLELQDGRQVARQVLLDSRAVLREGAKLHDAIVDAAR